MTSPQPPYGQPAADPSAQGAYGQPAPGQPAPGYASPGQLPGGYAQAVPPAAPKKGKAKKIIAGVITFVVIIGVKVAVGDLLSDDPVHAKPGQCVKVSGSDNNPDVKTLDCGDAAANYKVLSVVDNSFDPQACESVEGYTAGLAQQLGSEKFVLCLTDAK
ncbi:hypothetical protein [Kitasatospora sp. NBC_01539]|uniref:LppU/SCO3897 family protein n=1 Tax=Kitasatospora sp. NBC_01539 TaxID=2903577 RepID=UPI003860301F